MNMLLNRSKEHYTAADKVKQFYWFKDTSMAYRFFSRSFAQSIGIFFFNYCVKSLINDFEFFYFLKQVKK